MLVTARRVLGVSQQELAAAAGCSVALVGGIESGALDPAMDTLERIVNGSGLELRAGPRAGGGPYGGSGPDEREVARLRSVLGDVCSVRERLGAPPPGPPAGVLVDWDGQDPAPGRLFGSGEGRGDGGGWAAVLLRSAIAEARCAPASFAQGCGVDEAALERMLSGEVVPAVGELAAMLARAGTGLCVRLEVYDDHDDGLHLSFLADPERHRRRMQRAREIFADARA